MPTNQLYLSWSKLTISEDWSSTDPIKTKNGRFDLLLIKSFHLWTAKDNCPNRLFSAGHQMDKDNNRESGNRRSVQSLRCIGNVDNIFVVGYITIKQDCTCSSLVFLLGDLLILRVCWIFWPSMKRCHFLTCPFSGWFNY